MTIVPVRELAKYGIITDMDPFDLPPEAWSFGVNVRFRNGKVSRAPVFRAVTSMSPDPRYLFSYTPTSGMDLLYIGHLNGTISRFTANTLTDDSIVGYIPAVADTPWTHTTLGGVVYVNRSDRAPWSRKPADTIFQVLPVWDATWRAGLIRSCGGALVALNVTKAGTAIPTMVKTSSIATAGNTPTSWDHTVPATLATENILADMSGPILDAAPFGNSLAIYGLNETWLMTPDGSSAVYNYRKLPFRKGSLNANCSIQIDGKHLVFGPDDIWTHDGFSETSLCNGVVRDFIYEGLNLSKASRCFVSHNPKLKEVNFCYVSGDRGVYFGSTDACNRQAVYNYGNSPPTWTFDDLPLVYGGALANLETPLTYGAVTSTYDSIGSSYVDQEDGYKRTLCYLGGPSTTYGLLTKLYAFDLYGPGSSVVFPVDLAATAPVQLEKDGIDLDGLGSELKGYKMVTSITPQGRMTLDAPAMVFQMGGADYFGGPTLWDTTQTYNAQDLYKLDYRTVGRTLGLKMSYTGVQPFTLSGIDYDFHATGER